MFLWKFLKFNDSKYKGCYIPLELDFHVDFDFRETADLVAFTEEIVNGKLIFCAVRSVSVLHSNTLSLSNRKWYSAVC